MTTPKNSRVEWTPASKATLRSLMRNGKTYTQIAKTLKRSISSIRQMAFSLKLKYRAKGHSIRTGTAKRTIKRKAA